MKILSGLNKSIIATISLPASKSISNRVLIIHALCNKNFTIYNLSEADDTKIFQQCLNSNAALLNTGDGGTTLRFLLAYFALPGKPISLKASERMMQRPLKPIIDVLNNLGANIEFVKQKNNSFIKINSSQLSGGVVEMDATISSQFISALLLVAPYLKNGLRLNLKGKEVSASYTEMTIALMQHFGAQVERDGNAIVISNHHYQAKDFFIESDWSAASYWYSVAALSDTANIFLPNLFHNSLQGDRVIAEIMKSFGVLTKCEKNGASIIKQSKPFPSSSYEFDFLNTPDLFQTVCVLCAALNIPSRFTGLQTLMHKETDRLTAMKNELEKLNAVVKCDDYSFEIIKGINPDADATISTYNDHRMAMAFAPLALKMKKIVIENPSVVNKSYPGFWDELNKIS